MSNVTVMTRAGGGGAGKHTIRSPIYMLKGAKPRTLNGLIETNNALAGLTYIPSPETSGAVSLPFKNDGFFAKKNSDDSHTDHYIDCKVQRLYGLRRMTTKFDMGVEFS